MKRRLFTIFLFVLVTLCCFYSGSFAAGSSQSSASANDCVNINSASVDQLQQLPGIGPAIAQSIVNYREKNGPFATVEDLKKVKGIGVVKYNKVKDLVCV